MIIAWTFFITFCVLVLVSVTAFIAYLKDGEQEDAAKVFWVTILFLWITAIPAQFIFGN